MVGDEGQKGAEVRLVSEGVRVGLRVRVIGQDQLRGQGSRQVDVVLGGVGV